MSFSLQKKQPPPHPIQTVNKPLTWIVTKFIFASALLLATGAVSLSGINTAQAQEPSLTVERLADNSVKLTWENIRSDTGSYDISITTSTTDGLSSTTTRFHVPSSTSEFTFGPTHRHFDRVNSANTVGISGSIGGERVDERFADVPPPNPSVTLLSLSASHTGGVVSGGRTLLNAGDTATVLVDSSRALTTASLAGAAQFHVRFAADPPAQDLVATGTENQYRAVYTVRSGDLDALTFTLSGLVDDNANTLEDTTYDPDYFTDNTLPVVSLVGAASIPIMLGGLTPFRIRG